MRKDFLPPVSALSTAAPGSLGDAIRLGLPNGARLAGMHEAWWTPATAVPADKPGGRPSYRNLVRELAYPGSVLVNAAGVRFVDEASSYNDMGKGFLFFDATNHRYPNASAWLIFDAEFKGRYPIAGVGPSAPVPDWFVTASDLAALAKDLCIDPSDLKRTISAISDYAASGVDAEFGRGSNPHDVFNGDITHTPNACLRELNTPPFYALKVVLGINGTKGGLVTDPTGAVLDHDDQPLPGLFACGEAATALMGPGYAGAGASLGPALTAALVIGERVAIRKTSRLCPPDLAVSSDVSSGTATGQAATDWGGRSARPHEEETGP